ncbi:serine/threonine-protein kinase, partial [Agrococcus sp. TF02-05]|uniref:serine/threonine-protein kinase n=1 Tax=Agrococcus sp. TF02-05 TaxID=2815211 RepID=UPI001AA1777D
MIPGTVLASRYELVRPLGLGGMGQVWLGLDRVLGREVAVKTVDLSSSSDPSAAERFRREGRAAAALAHEHVVTVFDSGTDGSTAFLVMQLLPGPAVAELLEGGEPLPIDRAVEIAEQTAAALAAIHSIGIVHRDIKPANLVFDASGRLKVVDFGIASVEGTSGQLTATSTIVGSAAYMAPEQADGGRATPATDLYALGCVM